MIRAADIIRHHQVAIFFSQLALRALPQLLCLRGETDDEDSRAELTR